MENGEAQYLDRPTLSLRETPVMWGVPMDEIMYSKFFTIWVRHSGYMPWDSFATTESTYLPNARNEIHNQFLKSEFPYLMMLDSDIMFPPDMLEKLMEHDKSIIGGWYRNKHKFTPPHPIVYDFVSVSENGTVNWRHRDEPQKGVEKVDGMGAGCWLMKYETAAQLGESPYDMAGGTEDLKLSKKLMDLGIPLYVDWNIPCAHLGVSWT